MSISSANAAAASKTRRVETLTSGTSWTVPAGVEYVNATLIGGGMGGTGGWESDTHQDGTPGNGGQIITTTVTTTPGASIAYAIGAGGAGASGNSHNLGTAGGNTTFTGATTATGGSATGSTGLSASNGGAGGVRGNMAGGTGGSGCIELEYWV